MTWVKNHSDAIQAIAAVLGVLIGIVGFWLTLCQLRDTTNALRASNTYDIQRDSRDLVDKLQESGLVKKMRQGTLPPEEKEDYLFDVWQMFNFYLGVYRQVDAGGVSSDFAASFRHDFCQTVGDKMFDAAWKELLASKRISDANEKMREVWCAGK